MSIETLCPNCGYQNLLYIDELMGKYALCEKCRALFKFHLAILSDDDRNVKAEDGKESKLISGQSDSG